METIERFIKGCWSCRFILVMKTDTLALVPGRATKQFGLNEIMVRLGPLRPEHAAKLLLHFGKNNLESKYHDPRVLAGHEIFRLLEPYPKIVLDLVQYMSLQNKVSLDGYLGSLKRDNAAQERRKVEECTLRADNLRLLKEADPKHLSYDLLLMIAQFPVGLTFNDLKIMGESDYGFIPSDWRVALLHLLSFNNTGPSLVTMSADKYEKQIEALPFGNYYFLVKEENAKEKFYRVEGLIRDSLFEMEKEEFKKKERQSLLFVSFYLNYLVTQYRENYVHHELFAEFSQFSRSGFWGINIDNECYRPIFQYYNKV
jgi:hypothetical protein